MVHKTCLTSLAIHNFNRKACLYYCVLSRTICLQLGYQSHHIMCYKSCYMALTPGSRLSCKQFPPPPQNCLPGDPPGEVVIQGPAHDHWYWPPVFETTGIFIDSTDKGLLSRGDLISRSILEGTLTLWVPLKDGGVDNEFSLDSPLELSASLSLGEERKLFELRDTSSSLTTVCSDPCCKDNLLSETWTSFALDNASTAALVIESICFECNIFYKDLLRWRRLPNTAHYDLFWIPHLLFVFHLYCLVIKYKEFF